MPAVATVNAAKVAPASACKACHPQHFAEWSGSRHAAAVTDQLFQALVGVRQKQRAGKEDRFCTQCHSIVGVRSGDIHPGFAFSDLQQASVDAVSCAVCHGATEVLRTHNAGLKVDFAGPLHGNLADPKAAAAHKVAPGPLLQSAEFCAACHDVYELKGLSLERPFQEWQDSPAPDQQQTCQTCHMPTYDGQAAVGGPQRTGLHHHRFVGFDPPGAATGTEAGLKAGFDNDLAMLLGDAASLTVLAEVPDATGVANLTVSVANHIQGHSLPTGTTFLRQCWLEVTVRDASGKVLYQSGDLDANGDLRNRWSQLDPFGDSDLISFSSELIDASGAPTLFPWLAAEHHRNALRAGETKTFTYFAPIAKDFHGAIAVTARLRLRAAPPFLLRLVGLETLLPHNRTAELAHDATALAVP
jgi:hypothetical protein